MKIIYLFNGRLPTEKAHGLQIVKMCEAFARNGHHVILLSSFRRNPISEDIFSFYDLPRTFKYRLVPGLDTSWLPGRISYYFQTITSALLLTLVARRYRGSGTVFYARDYWSLFFLSLFGLHPVAELHDYRFRTPRWYVRFMLRRSHAVIVNSQGTRDLLLEHYRCPGAKILIAPNGVDVGFFDIPETQKEARRLIGLPEHPFVIGYVGRLETAGMEKGISLLLRAFAIFREHKTNVLLVIVGGPAEMAERYRREAHAIGIPDEAVRFVGQVPYPQTPLYLRAMDAVTIPLPSGQHAKTTSPIKLFEYLAAGKAIVASDLQSLRQYLNTENAIFFAPSDIKDLAEKLRFLFEHQDITQALGSAALRDAAQHTWHARAAVIIAFIDHGTSIT